MKSVVAFAILSMCVTPALSQNANSQANKTNPQVATLEKRIAALESRLGQLEYQRGKDDRVELDASSPGSYQRLNSNNGTFLVLVSNVEKYLNGYKLTLSIGNTSSATYNGFELTLKWGQQLPPGLPDLKTFERWLNSLKTRTQSYTQELRPASWNKVEMILLPAAANELGYLELSMQTNSISLYSR